MSSFADQVGQFMGPFVGRVPHNKRLGLRFETAGDRWVELQMPFAPQLLVDPDHGIWASGPIFTLMDTCVGMASMLARGAFEPHATLVLAPTVALATPGLVMTSGAAALNPDQKLGFWGRGVGGVWELTIDPNAAGVELPDLSGLAEIQVWIFFQAFISNG
jgi:hypothetical protein